MARRSDHTSDELRTLILDGAEAILRASGLEGLTAREIARRTGYSPGTIYNFFDNLDDVILHVEARLLDRLSDHLALIPTASDPVASMKTLARAYLAFTHDNARLWSLLFEHSLPQGMEVPAWYQAKLENLLERVEVRLRPFFPPRRTDQVREAARVLWASVHGITSLSVADKLSIVTTSTAGDLVDNLVTTYLNGLRRPGRHA